MLLKRLADVGLPDIQTLCDNKVLEGRFIDFKADPIGGSDRDKREFLADVSAFANASGGDLVLGVQTKDGVAQAVCGIVLDDPDKEKLRLGNIVRDGLEPRVSAPDMIWLPIEGSRGVMVVRAPRSWSAPHRVTFLRDMNFYVRNAAGKNPMSVDELRQAFNSGRDLVDRLRKFRADRIAAIVAKDLPVSLRDGPKLALHIVPLSAVVDRLDLEFRQGAPGIIPPLRNDAHRWQHTLEGFVTYTMPEPSRSYSLMFRDGAVEGVAGIDPNQSGRELSLHAFERLVLNGWNNFRAFADAFGVEPPVYVFTTLVDVLGLAPAFQSLQSGFENPAAARSNVIMLPEAVIGVERYSERREVLFKRTFDIAGNAFGLSGSPFYNAKSEYTG